MDEHCLKIYRNSDLRGDDGESSSDVNDLVEMDNSTLSSMMAEKSFDMFDN